MRHFCLTPAILALASLLPIAGCTKQDNSQIQHDTANATVQAKQVTKEAAADTKVALQQAENAVNAAANGVKQGIHTPASATATSPSNSAATGVTASGKIDLNSASSSQLSALPGITDQLAGEIVRHRPYAKPRDVVESGALTPAQYHRIAAHVTVQ